MLLPHAGRDGSRWVGRQHWDKKTKGTQAKYHLLTWPGGSKWQLGTWGALQYAQQHAAESQLYTSLMLLVGAGVHTLVLSGRWKIESCFSLSVSSSNAFCSMKKKKVVFNYISVLSILSSIGIMNAQNFSLQREGRCTIYYTNAKQVVILQSGSLGCYYGPDRQAPLTAWQRAPWTAMKSTRQNKASFPASCRTHSPFIPSVPLFFTLTSPGNTTAMAARLRVETSHRVPAPPQMPARLNPRASSGEKHSKSKHTQDHPEWEDGDHHNGESLHGHIHILHFINTIKHVEVGRLSYKVPAFLN